VLAVFTRYHGLVEWEEIKRLLHRTAWQALPDVLIHADVSRSKSHPLYVLAKGGDTRAAEGLIDDLIAPEKLNELARLVGDTQAFLTAVHAVEAAGLNAIPKVLALKISAMLDWPVSTGLIQINRVAHTGASGDHRLAFPALFGGSAQTGNHVLVDDFVGQGGTLANVKGYIEFHGGTVLAATALTGKAYSAQLLLTDETLEALRRKHGRQLEEWWIDTFGYSFEQLTESEARYITRVDNADTVRARLIDARRAGNQ
jgi:hypothetical protein